MSARRPSEGTAGFSLVEMLFVLAILGLGVGIGAPSIGGIIPPHRINAAAEAIVGEAALLRIEAHRTGLLTWRTSTLVTMPGTVHSACERLMLLAKG